MMGDPGVELSLDDGLPSPEDRTRPAAFAVDPSNSSLRHVPCYSQGAQLLNRRQHETKAVPVHRVGVRLHGAHHTASVVSGQIVLQVLVRERLGESLLGLLLDRWPCGQAGEVGVSELVDKHGSEQCIGQTADNSDRDRSPSASVPIDGTPSDPQIVRIAGMDSSALKFRRAAQYEIHVPLDDQSANAHALADVLQDSRQIGVAVNCRSRAAATAWDGPVTKRGGDMAPGAMGHPLMVGTPAITRGCDDVTAHEGASAHHTDPSAANSRGTTVRSASCRHRFSLGAMPPESIGRGFARLTNDQEPQTRDTHGGFRDHQ